MTEDWTGRGPWSSPGLVLVLALLQLVQSLVLTFAKTCLNRSWIGLLVHLNDVVTLAPTPPVTHAQHLL
jgi:hypothetical protein